MCGPGAGDFSFYLSTSSLDPSCWALSSLQQMLFPVPWGLAPPQAMISLYFQASLRILCRSFSLLLPRCGVGKAKNPAGTPSCCLFCQRGWAAHYARVGGWRSWSRGLGVWGPALNERLTLSRPRLAVHPFILPGSQGARQHPTQNIGTLSSRTRKATTILRGSMLVLQAGSSWAQGCGQRSGAESH